MTKILIVEDDPILRENLHEMLQFKGFVIQEACNGKEAWDFLQKGETDLILSDNDMPLMSGMKLLGKIKSSRRLQATPFILMTGRPDFETIREAHLLGATTVFSKPFPISRLDAWLFEEALAS